MAAAVIRNNMSHGQNLHVLPNNCVIVSSHSSASASAQSSMMHQHQSAHIYQHQYTTAGQLHQQQPHQQQHQQQPQQQLSPVQTNQTMLQPQQMQPQPPHHRLGKRLIAPAPAERAPMPSNIDTSTVRISSSSSSKKTNKLTYAHMPYGASQPASVQRRNARERNRVKQVNNGFANLRQHIPSDVVTTLGSGGRGASKKLSKVDTLRIAVEYIRRLQDLLDDNDTDAASSASSSSSRLSQNSTGSFYSSTSSPMQCTSVPPPPCSESSASPTPSYTSENSSIGGTGTYATTTPYKYEVFDAYNPEDEELLDCITWWQQQ